MRQVLVWVMALAVIGAGGMASADALDNWDVSCGAEPGAVVNEDDSWTFRPSRDFCNANSPDRRSEIASGRISATTRGAWLFSTYVTLRVDRYAPFDIFRVHDGRTGCTPPLKLNVTEKGRLRFVAGLPSPEGQECVTTDLTAEPSQGLLRRDGVEQKLEILVVFDGSGGFEATAMLDGRPELKGVYVPGDPQPARGAGFEFRHGVFTPEDFAFELQSRDLSVSRVRVTSN